MGVVTRGNGGVGVGCEMGVGATARVTSGATSKVSSLENVRTRTREERKAMGDSSTSVVAGHAGIRKPAKRKALASNAEAQNDKNTRRRVSDKKEKTTVDDLPDHVLEVIFGHLASDSKPNEYFDAMLTCSRFEQAGTSKRALSHAGERVLAIKAKDWKADEDLDDDDVEKISSPETVKLSGASAFANAAVAANSTFAKFFVGSINFYCRDFECFDTETNQTQRQRAAELLTQAALDGSEEAHHALAIMHFNGSGGLRRDKDPEAGAALCARGNIVFNSVSAKRELGHCLQDGFGVEQDVALGKKLLQEAAAIDDKNGKGLDAAVVAASKAAAEVEEALRKRNDINTLNAAIDAAAEVAEAAKSAAEKHLTATTTNRFLLDWYGECEKKLLPGTTSCSHPLCGRVETRRHEFRRCSCCGRVRYCSRSCQSADWRLQHKFACLPLLELYGWAESDADSVVGEINDNVTHQAGEPVETQ